MHTAKWLLLAVASVAATQATLRAAELTLTRQSRLATSLEIADGAPLGSVVHDFFVTSQTDLLSLFEVTLDVPLFQHGSGSDVSPPVGALTELYPGLAADSFFTMPGHTISLGDGFAGGRESLWGDLSKDGPQNSFRFGRLTSPAAGTFGGTFALRGAGYPINVPFTFDLPDASAGAGVLAVGATLHLAYSTAPPSTPTLPPPVLPHPPIISPPFTPPVTPPNGPPVATPHAVPPGTVNWGSVTLTRTARVVTPSEVAGGAPSGGLIHEFFVTSSTDILSVGEVAVTAPLYQHADGVDNAARSTTLTAISPALGVDSFIDTPGDTLILGDGFANPGTGLWGDLTKDGGQSNFLFARLTSDAPGDFTGTLAVLGGQGPVNVPFHFSLPGVATELPLSEADSTISVQYSLDPPPPPPPYVPAPPIPPPHAPHVPVNDPIVETPPVTPPFDPIAHDPPSEAPSQLPIDQPSMPPETPPVIEIPHTIDVIDMGLWQPLIVRGFGKVWLNVPEIYANIDYVTTDSSSYLLDAIAVDAMVDGIEFSGELTSLSLFRNGVHATSGLMAYDGLATADLNGLSFQTAFAQALNAMADGAPAPEPASGVLALFALAAAKATHLRQLLRVRRS